MKGGDPVQKTHGIKRAIQTAVLITVIIGKASGVAWNPLPLLASAELPLFDAEVIQQSDGAAVDSFVAEVIRIPAASDARGKILIYHTHTYEAYEQTKPPYQQLEKWRTKDPAYNVIRVGQALASCLEALGYDVVHETTAFEPPTLDDAYARSLSMLEERTKRGETYDLLIDLHRDALAASSTVKRTVDINGEKAARFMVLVGQGSTGGYTEKPDWEQNLIVAQDITEALNNQVPGIARDVKIKTGRYNQHISPRCILVECGMNTNTLDEVLRGIPYLADAIVTALSKAPPDE